MTISVSRIINMLHVVSSTYNVQDYSVLYNIAVHPVICEGCHFTYMWKTLVWLHHLTTREVWAYKTSLTSPLFNEVLVPSQECELSCICLSWVSILPLSMISIFDLGIVPTVWYSSFFILFITPWIDFSYTCIMLKPSRFHWTKVSSAHSKQDTYTLGRFRSSATDSSEVFRLDMYALTFNMDFWLTV